MIHLLNQGIDLILHQCDQWRDDNRTAGTQQGRNLVTKTLAAPGGHQDQRIATPVPDQLAYSLSKQALWQATATLAVAFGARARVNAVAPGLTLPTDDYSAGQMTRLAARMPLGALPTPDDIADAVAWLARAEAVTGQTIFVDGGAHLAPLGRDFVALERD